MKGLFIRGILVEMKILISNDDGIDARGLHVLAKAFEKLGEVFVVAPLEEKSTTGHSLTLHKPLRMIKKGPRHYAVNGSPADCVYLGIRELIRKKPDLVVSGVNRGANLGQDVYYSGTVSAAREASFLGIPSMAVSTAVNFFDPPEDRLIHYESAARQAVQIIRLFSKIGLKKNIPKHTLMNLNVPDLPFSQLKPLRLGKQGFRFYSGKILKRKDHRGKNYFWVGGTYEGFQEDCGTDCDWVEHGHPCLVPLKLDVTDHAFAEVLRARFPRLEKK